MAAWATRKAAINSRTGIEMTPFHVDDLAALSNTSSGWPEWAGGPDVAGRSSPGRAARCLRLRRRPSALDVLARPGVGQDVALGKRVGRIDENVRHPGDPGRATDCRHDPP